MSKVLVIPDLHGRNFWRQAISNNIGQVDYIVFLGDYLDPYVNEIEEDPDSMECIDFFDYENLLKMLNDIVSLKKNEPDKYILLCGNHICHYIWNEFKASDRTDKINWEKYHKFFLENLKYFNLVWTKDNCIFSHAGISEKWAETFLETYMEYEESALEGISYVRECAEILRDTELKDFNINYINAISNISLYRWGSNPYGSCEWADIREHIDHHLTEVKEKIVPLGEDGIYQVFGHTQLRKELITDKWACLDCRQGFIFDTITYECKSCL